MVDVGDNGNIADIFLRYHIQNVSFGDRNLHKLSTLNYSTYTNRFQYIW